jgi:hypothetical protein
MIGWSGFWAGLAGLWGLFWLVWTLDIYETDDIFVMAFVELAVMVPLCLFLLAWLVCRLLGRNNAPRR